MINFESFVMFCNLFMFILLYLKTLTSSLLLLLLFTINETDKSNFENDGCLN